MIARWILLAALSLLAACQQNGEQQQASAQNRKVVACAILEDYVTAEFDRAKKPLWLTATPTWIAPSDINQTIDELRKRDPDGPSEHELKQKLVEIERLAKLNPVEECRGLAKIREARSIPDPPDKDAPKTTDDGLFYHYEILSVQVPHVDLNKGEATFEVAQTCGPLCGSGAIITYLRDHQGQWSKADETGTWIS